MRKSRRDFLRLAAGSAGVMALPASIRKALAIPANHATRTIKDVEHVVILMQENRSFDHYFGSLRGVRGFDDPRPAKLPNGSSVWHQPVAATRVKDFKSRGLSPDATYVLPWYLNPQQTTEFQAGTDHGWQSGHGAWNNGRYDQWVDQKKDALTMGYLKRQDVSFHYALADAFTLCDAYHCSVHADTAPNRIYLWSGTSDPRNIYGTKKNGPGLEERNKINGYTWTTSAERLEKNGVSWRVYQGGTGLKGDVTDNFTDNSLEFFAKYQVAEGASAASELVKNGVTNHTLLQFRDDVKNGRLPQVSWIVPPEKYSEHPTASPTDGAYYINKVLEALTSSPEVWSKTVIFINYDENDGLFDHIIPPMPPRGQVQDSTGLVSDDLVDSLLDEFVKEEPIGLGPRVPMLILSPWTKGGWVCSQTFDHTSVLQFLEKRFDIPEPNISQWRRAVCGDLTSAFDFAGDADRNVPPAAVPKAIASQHRPYQIPNVQVMPAQESGTRPARALPYEFMTQCRVEADKISVEFISTGKAGAAFYAYNGNAAQEAPRRYTVSAGKVVSDYWNIASTGKYDISIYGPNGYLSSFRGKLGEGTPSVEVRLRYEPGTGSVVLLLTNFDTTEQELTINNAYSSKDIRQYKIAAGASIEDKHLLNSSVRWFDLSVSLANSDVYLRRFAGHLETGRPGTSDPGPEK